MAGVKAMRKVLPAIALAASLWAWALAANASGPKSAAITHTSAPIKLDGALDEPAWAQAVALDEIQQREPQQESPASERTEVRLLKDQNQLYVGVLCHDAEPEKIVGTQMRRDASLEADDRIEILLDTFHDRRNAFYFATNPAGALVDGLVIENGRQINFDWNAIWMCA